MRKVRYLRFAVALAAVLAVFASMQHHGVAVGSICMLCPVGFLSLTAASGSVAWALVPGVVAGLAIVLLVGRAFCSWLCPTGALKNLFGGRSPRGVAGRAGRAPGPCAHSCSAGSLKTQAVVLIVLLAVSFVVHFPVFCLICPIGLALGTVYAVSRAFVLWQPGWELAIFPLRRFPSAWCALSRMAAKARAKRRNLRPKAGGRLRRSADFSDCGSDEKARRMFGWHPACGGPLHHDGPMPRSRFRDAARPMDAIRYDGFFGVGFARLSLAGSRCGA